MADTRIITPEEAARRRAELIANAAASVTVEDYNKALEDRLLRARSDRGYTDRDPSEYYNSSVPRWAQDARDWVAYRDRVMLYGLQVLNQYQQTGVQPMTLDQFRAELDAMEPEWTYQEA